MLSDEIKIFREPGIWGKGEKGSCPTSFQATTPMGLTL